MSEGSAKDTERGHVSNNGQALDYGDQQKPRRRKMANPAPVGLFAFAGTTFLLSMLTVHTRNVTAPNAVVGMAIFGGGLVQLLAGMWEIPNGNTFGATAFAAYGGFWMSYATINIPASGIQAAYGGATDEFNQAVGLYLMTWFMITCLFILPCLRRNLAFSILLSVLAIAYLLLGIGSFSGSPSVNKAGGVFGILTGLLAFYIGVAFLMMAERTALFQLPLGMWSED